MSNVLVVSVEMFHFRSNARVLYQHITRRNKRVCDEISNRCYSTEIKRFYKDVSISRAEGGYEINLDRRKLKTPLGKLFQVPTEALALAVAGEWEAQDKVIKRYTMHLNSLCNTAIDNPTGRTKGVVISGILDYLETDTICYRLEEPEDLAALQNQEWDPLIDRLKNRYGVEIEPTTGLAVPNIPWETLNLFRQHLDSFNDWALVGYQQAVECLKSMIIAFALIDRTLTVERAVQLSRLEQEFQISKWGNVEWYHDVDLLELRARLAAATLFVHLNSEDISTTFTKSASRDPV